MLCVVADYRAACRPTLAVALAGAGAASLLAASVLAAATAAAGAATFLAAAAERTDAAEVGAVPSAPEIDWPRVCTVARTDGT